MRQIVLTWASGIGIAVAGGVAVFFAVYYAMWAYRTKQRTGVAGLVQHSRLTCPKCTREFDYAWVPGAALKAVRLGSRRYMACPLCSRWSMFDVRSSLLAPAN